MDDERFDEMFGDFDPYELLVNLSHLTEELAKSHNGLVEDYKRTLKRLTQVEADLIDLQMKTFTGTDL